MKFFAATTFQKAWAKCRGIGGYIPCPKSDADNKQLRTALNMALNPNKDITSLTNLNVTQGLPEIWLAVKKTGDNWDCKLREDQNKEPINETIGKFWGFKDTKPTLVQYKDKYQDISYNYDKMLKKDNRLKGPKKGKWVPFRSFNQRAVMNSGLVTDFGTSNKVRSFDHLNSQRKMALG